MSFYNFSLKTTVFFYCLCFAISDSHHENLSSPKPSSFSLRQEKGSVDNENENNDDDDCNSDDDVDPDTFSVFKYFGYGTDITQRSLTSDDPERNFTTHLLEPLFRFCPSKYIWRNLTLPDIIDAEIMERGNGFVESYVFDSWRDAETSDLSLLANNDTTYLDFPANFSSQYLTANRRSLIAAQTLVENSFFITRIEKEDVNYLAKRFVEAATALAHLSFNATTWPLFYAFFRRFGTHYNDKINFGKQIRVTTLLEIDFYQKYGKNQISKFLEYDAQNISDGVPAEFYNHSRSVRSYFGWGDGEKDRFRFLVPVASNLPPIHHLLIKAEIISPQEADSAWSLALKTYLFEHELRSIRDVLTAFKGDLRSELCFLIDKRAGDNLRRTEELLSMKPFPDSSLWTNRTEPGGYRDLVEWHLGECIPSNRDLFNGDDDPDTFSVFKYQGYGLDVTKHSLNSNDPKRNFTTNLLDPVFRFLPGTTVWSNLTLPRYIDAVQWSTTGKNVIHLLDHWRDAHTNRLSVLNNHKEAFWLFPFNFSSLYLQANHQGLVAAQIFLSNVTFFSTVKISHVNMLAKNFREAASKLAHLSFNETTKQLFFAFFRRFGSHYNYQMTFGTLTRANTLLEIGYFKTNTRKNIEKYLELNAQKLLADVPKDFLEHSRSNRSTFGSGNMTEFRLKIPVMSFLKPIYDLLKNTNITSKEKVKTTWNLALETYLFEYELRSIQDVLTAFDSDFRSELCSLTDLHQRGVHNLHFTEQYLSMKPFPDRSLPLYSKVPGGYQDRIEWHLGDCIPSNRDMYSGSVKSN